MSGNNFTRKYTISKQSGPGKRYYHINVYAYVAIIVTILLLLILHIIVVYINSYALNGIGVRYRNPTIGLDPVSLPTGWTLPRIEDSYRVRIGNNIIVVSFLYCSLE